MCWPRQIDLRNIKPVYRTFRAGDVHSPSGYCQSKTFAGLCADAQVERRDWYCHALVRVSVHPNILTLRNLNMYSNHEKKLKGSRIARDAVPCICFLFSVQRRGYSRCSERTRHRCSERSACLRAWRRRPEDPKHAASLYFDGARYGDPEAQFSLGWMYA